MDGINTEKTKLNGEENGTSVKDTVLPLPLVNIDEIYSGDSGALGNNANAENELRYPIKEKLRIGVILRRGICLMLVMLGLSSYTYLGYCGVDHMKNGGFARIVARGVFGGSVSRIAPITKPEDQVQTEVPESEENSADAENIKISPENIGCQDPEAVFNETGYDLNKISVPAVSTIPEFTEDSAVLIIHTHGTEGYSPEGDSVSADEDFRTDDSENNMIAVGKAFAEILEKNGVNTIHCTEMFDRESYIDAYDRSADAVREYMKIYPEIACVLDIHRDAVIREDGTVVKSDGGGMAQLMIVCGTDEMGADFPDWRENFAFGREYQERLFAKMPENVRHMNLRSASFNQQLCDRYLLLEVGTCGNTLAEAKAGAEAAAEVFARMLLEEE